MGAHPWIISRRGWLLVLTRRPLHPASFAGVRGPFRRLRAQHYGCEWSMHTHAVHCMIYGCEWSMHTVQIGPHEYEHRHTV